MSGRWQNWKVLDWDCEVFRPADPEARFGVFYLHDEVGGNDLAAFEEELDRHGLWAVVPQCGPTWWLDKPVPSFDDEITPQQFLRDHLVPRVRAELKIEPPCWGLVGHGMGGQGALKLAYVAPTDFPVVAAIAPSVDFHLLMKEGHPVLASVFEDVEAARQNTPILHVHPLNWPRHQFFCCDPEDYFWFDSADRLRMKLGSIGIAFEAELQESCEGDRAAYLRKMLPRALQFAQQRLDQHRRSLI